MEEKHVTIIGVSCPRLFTWPPIGDVKADLMIGKFRRQMFK